MLETGGILIVMGVVFAVGVVGEWILSLFYRRYLRDTADMSNPKKKLVKLTKLRYETSYYLNGTVHNAKTMVDGMLEHYRLIGLRLWTWHHIATMAAFLCGVMGFAIGGAYVVGRFYPGVKELLPLSGMNALIYTLAGGALAAMLLFWQSLLDNRTKRSRLESNLVDYFDNEKFHQLGREIALSGRVREIAGDRGRREDPGSIAAEGSTDPVSESAATDPSGGTSGKEAGESGTAGPVKKRSGKAGAGAAKSSEKKEKAVSGKAAAKAERSVSENTAGRPNLYESYEGNSRDFPGEGPEETTERTVCGDAESSRSEAERWESSGEKGTQPENGVPSGESAFAYTEDLPAGKTSGGMTIGDIISSEGAILTPEAGTADHTVRSRSTSRKKPAASSTRARAKNVQIAQEEMEERRTGGSKKREKAVREVIIPLNPENGMPESGADADRAEKQAGAEAAATEVSANLYADAKAAREEELLRLLREYMGL